MASSSSMVVTNEAAKPDSSCSPLKLIIGVLGFGTVGGGVVRLLQLPQYSPYCWIKKICVHNASKKRDTSLPLGCEMTTDVFSVVTDPEINCIVEVMGGVGVAKEAMLQALSIGKHVVTANKAAIGLYMEQFEKVLLTADPSQRVGFFYEAAVCGGVPIINVIRRGFFGDRIMRIVGILNGTCNFMLTKMDKEGVSYQHVLNDAQQLGYAEADPTADVDGHDTRSKLCILAKLAFGMKVETSHIFCHGIRKIVTTDFQYAKMINHTIKLLGIAEITQPDSNRKSCCLSLCVCPVLVPYENPISTVEGVTNVVQVFSENLESSMYVGPGAGRFPTANSVVADIGELLSRIPSQPESITSRPASYPCFPPAFPTTSTVDNFERDFCAEFFIRFIVSDEIGVVNKISAVCEKHEISIFSILQTPIIDPTNVPFVIVTEACRLSQVTAFCEDISHKRLSTMGFLKEEPLFIRYYKT